MPPTPLRTTLTWTSLCGSRAISSSKASSEPETSALSTRLSSWTAPSWMPLKMSSKDTLRPARRAWASLRSRTARSLACWRAARSFSTTRNVSPASGTPSKPRTSTGWPGTASLQPLAGVVLHRADAAPVRAGHDRVADLERAALDEHRDDGAAARVELGLDDDARRVGVRVGLEVLELGDDEDRLEQVLEVLVRLGRHVDELGVAAPLRRLQAALRELGAHARRVGALLVDLVDRDEDRHLGRLGVVDRLVGLRLHAVVGGDDDHRDVGDLRAAGAHGGERLVARRVEEGDRAAVVAGPGRRRCAA